MRVLGEIPAQVFDRLHVVLLTVKVWYLYHHTLGAQCGLSFTPAAAVQNNGCKSLGEVKVGPGNKAGSRTAHVQASAR